MKPHQMNGAKALVTLLAGALFGFGLSVATMVQPEVVIGFLRFQDWGLMLVMGGAAGVSLCGIVLEWRVATHGFRLDTASTNPARLTAFNETFLMLAAVCALALVAALRLREQKTAGQ